MKNLDERKSNTSESSMEESTEQRADSISAKPEQKVGYPDISKADTKTVVLISFIVIVLVFLLSIVFPQPSSIDGTTEQSTTQTTYDIRVKNTKK